MRTRSPKTTATRVTRQARLLGALLSWLSSPVLLSRC